MSSNKGITLVVLIITVILLLILSGTAVYVGKNTIKNAKEEKFINQLKEINEAVSMHSEDYQKLNLAQVEYNQGDIAYNYIIADESDFNKLGLYNIKDIVYVNFEEGQVYSKSGFNGKHTLEDFGIEYYKPEQEEKNVSNKISFDIKLEPQEYSWKYVVYSENIKCNGNPLEGNLLYAEYKENQNYEWKRVNKTEKSFELELKKPGKYMIKYIDSEGKESETKTVYSFVKDGLQAYYDGEFNENYNHNNEATSWIDFIGNKNITEINANWQSDGFGNKDSTEKISIPYSINTNTTLEIDCEIDDSSGSINLLGNPSIGNTYYTYITYSQIAASTCPRYGVLNQTYERNQTQNTNKYVCTFENNGYVKIYVNGNFLAQKKCYSPDSCNSIDLEVKKCKLNRIKIYNRILGDNEIKQNYLVNK